MNDILRQLQLDQTFFQAFALFWVFFFLFSNGVVKPIQKLMALRLARTRQEREKLQELSKSLKERAGVLDVQTRAFRLDVESQVEAMRRQAEAEAAKALHSAREDIRRSVQKAQEQLVMDEKKISEEIRTQIAPLIELGAERLVGRRSP